MNFILRYLFQKHIEPEREAYFLGGYASKWGFDLFKDKNFREKIEFEKQNQTEQDRIFNELVVTALVYVLVFIDDKLDQQQLKESRYHFWRNVLDSIAPMYLIRLSNYKIPQEFINTWEKLIDLRLTEFYERRQEAYQVWDEDGPDEPNELKKDTWIGLEALRISSMLHLTRGKAEPDHPLKNILRTWLIGYHNKLAKRIGW